MKRDLAKVFEDFIKNADDMAARIKNDTEIYRKSTAHITVTIGGKPAKNAKLHFYYKPFAK